MSPASVRRYLSLGAVAGILVSSAYVAAPAWAADGQAAATASPEAPAAGTPVAGTQGSGLSEAALDDAVQRDLGLTREQFTAAGGLGAQAAAAAAQLRDVPGYAGIRLDDGHVVVTGSGPEFLAKVAALAGTLPDLAVEAPQARRAGGGAQSSGEAGEGSQLAVSTEQLFQAYVRDVGPEGLQAVMAADGKFVIRTGALNAPESARPSGTAAADATTTDATTAAARTAGGATAGAATGTTAAGGSGRVSPADFVARYANVELDGAAPLRSEADVPGGVGYIADTGWICSTGFSAFDPAGLPAVLSAGHCASDGQAATATLEFQFVRKDQLGEFGFSQFGGPGNSRIIENPVDPDNPGNVGTDISVIHNIPEGLDPLPAASTWGDPSEPGPDVKIIGTADPVLGMPICRSGRTSAWSCGTVDAVGIYVVPGPDFAADPTDLRAFRGFLSYGVQSSGGDSGGPYVSGNYAVGTHAAGDAPPAPGEPAPANFAVGATLSESLAVLPGYQLELFLNKPAVSSPAPGGTYEPGQAISGNVPAAPASAVAPGSTVKITVEGKDPVEVPVDAAGTWSFTAPEGNGPLRFTAETANGFSTSGGVEFEFARAAAEPPAPEQPAPGNPAPEPPAPEQPNPIVPADPAPVPAVPADPAAPAPAAPAPAAPQPPADAGTVVVPFDAGTSPADLANTGPSGLIPAAMAAAAALAVGIILTVLVRRRSRRSAK
ncbi:S1 family peptidase [Pseudarthrobacter sp. SL88]|uniref:S1 family peptidase n=1 Tax=Pseudarthrobacter sp. SL88 TaxID=2994666 RepID=UPI0022751A9D|nr:S1 family peptidase [Pseudarthrobacter sp. SL88]MCY1673732.1 S1 family peptidase [Pseudarthrobacter sp. SL88]